MESNKEIKKKVETLKKEIQIIVSNLKELGGLKEEHYKQKNSLDRTLSDLINKAKELKERKHAIDKRISRLKKEREAANKKYSKLISEIKGLEANEHFDNKIIEKQKSITKTIETQYINGLISIADYIKEQNKLEIAKINSMINKLEIEKLKYKLKVVIAE